MTKNQLLIDEYTPGVRLDQETIRVIFEHEVMKIAKPRTYMGIWQMIALSTVLQVPLHSVYPNLGNPVVRSDLNRKVKPRVKMPLASFGQAHVWT